MNSDFSRKEQMILLFLIKDESYFYEAIGSLKEEWFEDENLGIVLKEIKKYYDKYKQIPTFSILDAVIEEKYKEEKIQEIRNQLKEIEQISVDCVKHRDWMLTETDKWIKNNAIKQAIIKSVDLVETMDYEKIEEYIRDALMSGIKSDIGLIYFDKIKERILRLQAFLKNRMPTGFKKIDKIMNGGIYVPSLSVFLGKINIGKSLILTNLAKNFSDQGKNVVIITMEIPEDLMAQRLDAHFTGDDINELYISIDKIKNILNTVKKIREKNGEIFIKEFPPAMTTVNDIRRYLNELRIMGKKIDVIMVDYINLLGSGKREEGMYSDKKRIAEELRALSFMTKAPVITVSQLNREGYFKNFDEIDIENSSESMGIPAAADFMAVLGKEENLTYLNEMAMKVIKNRMGSKDGIGTIKFYLNPYSLRLYDSEEEFIKSFDSSGGRPQLMSELYNEENENQNVKKNRNDNEENDDFFLY